MSPNRLVTALLCALTLGCNTHTVEPNVCGQGDNVQLPTDRELCVYQHPIVIETGFTCPAARRDFFVFEPHFGTCSDFGPPVGIERDFLVDRYGVAGRPWPTLDVSSEPPETDQLDLLWVIDNSGSMCQEQALLRDNFESFIDGLAAESLDFQVAITTTHMNAEYALEPVAEPGVIQSRPQPVPGFDRSCHTAVDEMGVQIDGDYAPIRQNIEVAVNCMVTPNESLLEVTNAEIECALYSSPQGCSIDRVGCGGAVPCTPESLFPETDSYREIPKIMRSSDYMTDGELDVAAMVSDFSCASLVGTRGYGIEKGLAAAVAAVSPQNIDGLNNGLLRDEARFAVMFVSDENDCSHDGTLSEDTACGGDVCEFWNAEDLAGAGPLIPVTDLKSQLLGNLSVSKGRTVTEAEVFVGSIHGEPRRFSGEVPSDAMCGDIDYTGIEPTCATSLGVAFSGDRYNRFTAQFRHAFPAPGDDAMTTGWICRGDFSPAVGALGEWLGTQVR